MLNDTARFVQALPVARQFSQGLDEAAHASVLEAWFVAVTDVVGSRDHITRGRYKEVNMAGVAMISAAMNELGFRDMPYVFGGDGAALALGPAEAQAFAPVLGRVLTMAREELGLEVRGALVPVSRLRLDGFDVKIQPVRVSPSAVNFAFTGGGLAHAERLLKAGEYAVPAAAAGQRPNLEGLSCRWMPVQTPDRKIVSLIVEPGAGADALRFGAAAVRVVDLLGLQGDGGSTIPASGPGVGWPARGLELEARATRGSSRLWVARLKLALALRLALLLFRREWRLGAFDPLHYQQVTGRNTDFRKVQDGLRMTVSLAPPEANRNFKRRFPHADTVFPVLRAVNRALTGEEHPLAVTMRTQHRPESAFTRRALTPSRDSGPNTPVGSAAEPSLCSRVRLRG